MESVYHYCFSADEIICRDEEDCIRFINCFALALYSTGSVSLADAVMSNHFHTVPSSPNIKLFSKRLRYSYTRYFNCKYKRKGELGERRAFAEELKGVARICTAISYVLRNPLHHGVSATPFGYRFSSIGSIFTKELGLGYSTPQKELSKRSVHKWLPKGATLPANYIIEQSSIISRKCFTNTIQTEILYGSVRNFLFQMTRLSGEDWIKEQERDGKNYGKPITLEDIESPAFQNYVSNNNRDWLNMLYRNEKLRHHKEVIQDFELCSIIDISVKNHYKKESVYTLSREEREELANLLSKRYHIYNSQQIARCLVL